MAKTESALPPFPPPQEMGHETVESVFSEEGEALADDPVNKTPPVGDRDRKVAEALALGDDSPAHPATLADLEARVVALEGDVHWLHAQLGATMSTFEGGTGLSVRRVDRVVPQPSE